MRDSDLHTCPLCGHTFDAGEMACHASCPLSVGCHLICCPNCGYQVPDERRMVVASALRRAWEALTPRPPLPRREEGESRNEEVEVV